MIFLVEFNLDISTRHIDMNSVFAPDREGGQIIISAPSRADREGGQIIISAPSRADREGGQAIISAPSRADRRLPSLTHPLERMTARAPGEKVETGFSQNPARNKEARPSGDSY